MKYYVDNAQNRKLNRVGKPIVKYIKEKNILKKGVKVKVTLPYTKKRVIAIYKETIGFNLKKIVVEYNGITYGIDIDLANLKVL